jgi:hypothetical protein
MLLVLKLSYYLNRITLDKSGLSKVIMPEGDLC